MGNVPAVREDTDGNKRKQDEIERSDNFDGMSNTEALAVTGLAAA
jgi:hypothetical protein